MQRRIGIICQVAAAGVALAAVSAAEAAKPQPFKLTNIHFETNSSACDMGIQISFDTDGVSEGLVEDPHDRVVYSFRAVDGLEGTHDITEGFQERVEPPIIDLENALGCDPSAEAIPLSELLASWPAGRYDFEGRSGSVEFEGIARLTHKIPAGPEITAPDDGDIVPHDAPLLIKWRKVTRPILPSLGPVEVVGYHVLVVDVTVPVLPPGKTKTSFDADVSRNETSFLVPKQYLEPNRIYELEILATEKGGNQTITEGGVFCTPPRTAANCQKP
ncbi:MAG TPA: hypothetical protein VH814_25025 [Steroidobacteraceae bacterium]|jgi:hypothetical protein